MLLYRLILSLVLPAIILRGLLREPGSVRARLRPPDTAGRLWVHAASLGELNAVRPILPLLPGPILLTCNSTTGLAAARGWGLADVAVALAPYDLRWLQKRALAQARGLVIVENEIWPNRIDLAHRAGLPVIWLGARMSARSARRWQHMGGLARHLLGRARLVVPQDQASAARLAALGVPDAAMTQPQDLKSLYRPPEREVPADLHAAFARSDTVLAAATHEGEEAIALEAFRLLRAKRPEARLIIAPRHPDRGEAVAALVREAGYEAPRRGRGEAPAGPVYVADTLGEMDLWYRLSGAAFVGGSLVERGGHTPHEPAAHGCAILHGPHVANFAESYAALDAAGGAIPVSDAASLATGWAAALDSADTLAGVATSTLRPVDPEDIARQIAAALRPMA